MVFARTAPQAGEGRSRLLANTSPPAPATPPADRQPAFLKGVEFMFAAFAVALFLCSGAIAAQAAGFRLIDIPADGDRPAIHGATWAPCAEPAGEIKLGSFTLPGVKDCPIVGEKLPLVVISHGAGGNFVNFHDVAETLADAGFVVAAIDHPGNSSSDMSRIGAVSTLTERPEDVKRLVGFMTVGSGAAPKRALKQIGFFAFSRG